MKNKKPFDLLMKNKSLSNTDEIKPVYRTYDVNKEWLLEQLDAGKSFKDVCCVLKTNYETLRRLLVRLGIYDLYIDAYKKRLKTKTYTLEKEVFLKLLTNCYKITEKTILEVGNSFSEEQIAFLKTLQNKLIPEKDLKSESLFSENDLSLLLQHCNYFRSPKLTGKQLQKELNLDEDVFNRYLKKYQLKRFIQNNEQEIADAPLVASIAEKIRMGMSVQKIADELGQKQHQVGYFVRKYHLNNEELMGTRKRPSKRKGIKKIKTN